MNTMRITGVVAAMMMLWAGGGPGWADREVTLFDRGQALCALDVSEEQAQKLGLTHAANDFLDYFERMTGVRPQRSSGTARLFDVTAATPVRFAVTVVSMDDLSALQSANADVGLAVSPTRLFHASPLAGPGEKVVFGAGWDRGGGPGTLTFRLSVANKAYYGPGYGPFTFAEMQAPPPAFADGERLILALEIRGGDEPAVRGGFTVNGENWQWTDWHDPATAGTDLRVPGESDKNGPQAWTADWPAQWAQAGATLHVFGYGARDRQAVITVDEVAVARGDETVFHSDFSAGLDAEGAIVGWSRYPEQGLVSLQDNTAVMRPAGGNWSTVGLRAQTAPAAATEGLVPIRVHLRQMPAGTSRLDTAAHQGFAIRARPEEIVIQANTGLGLANALYYMLDRWGCRWVMPGPLGECIPHHEQLTWPLGLTRFSPRSDFSVETTPVTSDQGRWFRRNMAGWHHWISAQHYWLYALPPERHFADNPEWYSLVGGERLPRQLCTTNPEVIAEMTRVAKEFLAAGENRVSFLIDPMDGIDFCQCAECTALDPPELNARGVPDVTDRVVAFANAVADGIREEFPDRYVAFYAYWTHGALPVRERPRENVIVIVCRDNHCAVHLNPAEHCPASDFHQHVGEWKKLTPNVFCYEYDPISWTGGLPSPTYLEMGRSLQTLLTEIGIRGSYSDGGSLRPEANPATFMNMYMARRMKLDPTQDPDELLSATCRIFYGPAAGPMEHYWRALARVAETTHGGRERLGFGPTFYHDIFAPEMLTQARRAMNEAQNRARGRDPYDKRTAMTETGLRYLEAYLDGVWSAQAGEYEAAVAGFDRMAAVIEEMAEKGWIQAEDARRRAETMRLKALVNHFPGQMGYETRWRILGPFANSGRDADLVSDPFEAEAIAGRPVTDAQGTVHHWWEYESPGGFVNIEQALADKADWPLSYCYAALSFNSDVALPARLLLDSFHPFKVFFNGKHVYHRPGLDADCPDKRVVDVDLREGENLVVIKLSQTLITSDSFPWGLYFRVDAGDRRPDAAAFPEKWAFRTDPHNTGVREAWFAPELDDNSWLRIPVGVPWEQTEVGQYDGFGWYRAKFSLPAELNGTALTLLFGAVDEQAWVYLNGRLIGEHTVDSTGLSIGEIWQQPFEIPVPAAAARFGEENVLAVRVHDSAYAGGIYRRVRLVADTD